MIFSKFGAAITEIINEIIPKFNLNKTKVCLQNITLNILIRFIIFTLQMFTIIIFFLNLLLFEFFSDFQYLCLFSYKQKVIELT